MSKLTKIVQNSDRTFLRANVTGSKAVKSIMYNADQRALYVTFRQGGEYRVDGVTPRQMQSLNSVKSIGRWATALCRKNGAEFIRG